MVEYYTSSTHEIRFYDDIEIFDPFSFKRKTKFLLKDAICVFLGTRRIDDLWRYVILFESKILCVSANIKFFKI